MSKKVIDLSSGQPRKMPGWHSWRHRTRDAQDAAREEYLTTRGRDARKERAAVRRIQAVMHAAVREEEK